MPTDYPEEFDTFIEPTLPEDTALSSAGTGDRNHVEHHRDMGDAIEAIQRNVALKGHDHSGDTDDVHKGAKLKQENTHESVDTDAGPAAIHHTLGLGSGQAAAGNHTHDYPGPTILRKPHEICPSTDRPEPFLGKTIWESDTNRMRVWTQFAGQQTAVQGLYYIDKFERTSSVDLGPDWEITYTPYTDGLHGKLNTYKGHAAIWQRATGSPNRAIARHIRPESKYTESFDQVITFNTNDTVMDTEQARGDYPSSNDAYFRMSDDGQTYVRAALTYWKGSTGHIMLLYTDSGPEGEQLLGQLPARAGTPNILWQLRLIGNKFEVYMGIHYVGSIADPTGMTLTGYKGWGFGMTAGAPAAWTGWYQDVPNELSEVGIADATYYTSSAIWQLLPVGDMPRVGLAADRAQFINPTGSLVEWQTVIEDNFGYYNPADPSTLVVTEPGIYYLHASVAWGTHLYGDHAATVLMINGQKTPHMHWEFVRGNTYTPGFSQTVDLTAYVRLNDNDRVAIAAAHNGQASQYTGYKKGSQITQLSRLMLTFHSG